MLRNAEKIDGHAKKIDGHAKKIADMLRTGQEPWNVAVKMNPNQFMSIGVSISGFSGVECGESDHFWRGTHFQ